MAARGGCKKDSNQFVKKTPNKMVKPATGRVKFLLFGIPAIADGLSKVFIASV